MIVTALVKKTSDKPTVPFKISPWYLSNLPGE